MSTERERDRRWGLGGGGKVFLGWKGETVRVEEMGVKREVCRQERCSWQLTRTESAGVQKCHCLDRVGSV